MATDNVIKGLVIRSELDASGMESGSKRAVESIRQIVEAGARAGERIGESFAKSTVTMSNLRGSVESSLGDVIKGVEAAVSGMKGTDDKVKGLKAEAGKRLEDFIAEIDIMTDGFTKTAKAAQKAQHVTGKGTENVQADIKKFQQEAGKRIDDFMKEIIKLTGATEDVGKIANKAGVDFSAAFDKSQNSVDNLRKNLDSKLKASLTDRIKQWTGFGKAAEEAGNKVSKSMKDASKDVDNLGQKIDSIIKTVILGAAARELTKLFVNPIKEASSTEQALDDISALGVKELELVKQAAKDYSASMSGTTRIDFITALGNLKGGISSLSDRGAVKMTEYAALTGKATQASVDEMTNLFIKGHGIYRDLFKDDFDFGEQFSAGISKVIDIFNSNGAEMNSFISNLGASAKSAGASMSDILTVGGQLQATMTGSEAATKMRAFYEAAYKAGQKLNLNFVDTNGQLKSVADIIDAIKSKYGQVLDAAEGNELSNAFGTQEALGLITQLYDKTGELRSSQQIIADAMEQGIDVTRTMANIMNDNVLAKLEMFRNKASNIGSALGEKMLPAVNVTFDTLLGALNELEANGALDSMAQSMSRLLELLTKVFIGILQHTPNTLKAVADAIEWTTQNIGRLVEMLNMLAKLAGAGMFIGGLAKIMVGIKTLPSPTGITHIMSGVDLIVKSGAVAVATSQVDKTLNNMSKTTTPTKTVRKLEPKKEPIENSASVVSVATAPVAASPVYEVSAAAPQKTSTTYSNSIETGYKDDRTLLEKALDKYEQQYSSIEAVVQSRIDLARAKGDENAEMYQKENLIDVLKEKLSETFSFKNLVGSIQESNYLEEIQNNLQAKIYNLIAEINDNVEQASKLITGGFNAPLETMNQYTFDTLNTNNVTRHVALNVYGVSELTDANIEKLVKRVQSAIDMDSIKNEVVYNGFRDILRR